ncbi:epoxide hydrolase [Amycolatopsis rhabdoformis]|uniref:Epoxide hydrolase n=1 Tax=Amycolatopsis rhabdoformis TaxID=1448059 RepID=A0ABZ1HYB6_9PSEU|nr:epoxide hydrolase [Amycolatopsis rhabdoformis]WSE27121.1 epoxide hydrolase [Amycolatopsis rhabdoformis]
MSDYPSEHSRRRFLATSAGALAVAAGASTLMSTVANAATAGSPAVRPFRIAVPQRELTDLRNRLRATRWPTRETVADDSQGLQLRRVQDLVKYWATRYDWRTTEAKLNSLPQFVTEIDGLDIHFLHIRSRHENALPIVITHGWPGSILEMLKVIGPLTDPTRHGGSAVDAFHVVIPSMPGYGFSGKPTGTGWGPARIARAWDVLMKRLGYREYVSQGGDWGSVVSDVLAAQKPAGLLGIHVNMPATVPPEIAKILTDGGPAPAGLSTEERQAFDSLNALYTRGSGYSAMMVTRPETVGFGLADSPAGLAAWMYDKFAAWTYSGGVPEKVLTRDEMLGDITLYWVTNTAVSSSQLYWENNANNFNAVDVSVPAAVTVFPGELYRAPRSWAERAYHDLRYYHQVDNGGHFAAWEQPDLFSKELRAAFRFLR